jgi:Flp pilus assembly protein TadG
MKTTKKPSKLSAAQAAADLVQKRAIAEKASREKRDAEAAFMEACAREGVEQVITSQSTVKVYIRRAMRSSYSLNALSKLLKPAQLRKVTKTVIDNELFESAVSIGIIEQSIADQATTVKEVVSVCISKIGQEEDGE